MVGREAASPNFEIRFFPFPHFFLTSSLLGSAMSNLTLYSAKICPFAQRVTFALQHLEIPHQLVEIDLQNKPADYATKVNRASKVPVLEIASVGGRKNAYFPESLIILELLSDLHPYKIMSEDPIKRAESRYFVGQSLRIVLRRFVIDCHSLCS